MSHSAFLIKELRDHALVLGRVTLSSGTEADYYVDAKRAYLKQPGFDIVGDAITRAARDLGATHVGGLTMGADPLACAAIARDYGLRAFFVRKETKGHGLQRQIEGPIMDPGTRVLVVEDVVTSGSSTIKAVDACVRARLVIVGVVAVLDRLAGGAERIKRNLPPGVPYTALATIDDVYPDRPDRDKH